MKKIIRLSENDLSRIIKKILKEQNQTNYDGNSVRIAKMFHKSVSGAGTDESGLIDAIKAIQTPQQFNEVNQIVKTLKGNMSIPQWINDELGEDDQGTWQFITKHLNSVDVPCRACIWIRGGINKIPASFGNFVPKSFSLGHTPCPAGTWIWKNNDSMREAMNNPYFKYYQDSKNIKDGKFIPPPAGFAGDVKANWKSSNKINLQIY
jgi:molybdopterin-biosynthesis enzyme MoeA-like protein